MSCPCVSSTNALPSGDIVTLSRFPPEVTELIFHHLMRKCCNSHFTTILRLSHKIYETHVCQLYEKITLHDGNVEAVFEGMMGFRDNSKPASLGGSMDQYKQYTFFKEWDHEDRFTVFPPYREAMEQAQGKIPFFKCHPGAQKIMLLKQCQYLRIQTPRALLCMGEALDNYAREADAFGAHNEMVDQFDFTPRHDYKLFEDMEGVSLGEELMRNLLEDPAQWLPPLLELEDAWEFCDSLCLHIPNDLSDAVANKPFRSTIYLVEALRPFHLIVLTFDLVPSPAAEGMDDSRKREAEVENIVEWCKVLAMVTDTEEQLHPVQLTFANFGTISSDETGEVRPLHVEKGIPFLQAPACQYYVKKIVDESHSNEDFAEWVTLMHSPPLLAGPYSCEGCGHDGNK
ncbi:hypothetical protein D1P53_000093 [Cryptococcus gattii VGV]|nr:hypothetical protein D1P53_000093 [Cryptococcus gattii VGV]